MHYYLKIQVLCRKGVLLTSNLTSYLRLMLVSQWLVNSVVQFPVKWVCTQRVPPSFIHLKELSSCAQSAGCYLRPASWGGGLISWPDCNGHQIYYCTPPSSRVSVYCRELQCCSHCRDLKLLASSIFLRMSSVFQYQRVNLLHLKGWFKGSQSVVCSHACIF